MSRITACSIAAVCNAIAAGHADGYRHGRPSAPGKVSGGGWPRALLNVIPHDCRWVAHATASSNAAEIGSEQSTPRVAAPPPAAQQGQHDRAVPLRSNVALTAAWMSGSSEDDGGEDVGGREAAMQLC